MGSRLAPNHEIHRAVRELREAARRRLRALGIEPGGID
jgi:Fe2+ transport system protein FeoA